MYMHIYIYTCIFMCICMYIYIYIYLYVYVYGDTQPACSAWRIERVTGDKAEAMKGVRSLDP